MILNPKKLAKATFCYSLAVNSCVLQGEKPKKKPSPFVLKSSH